MNLMKRLDVDNSEMLLRDVELDLRINISIYSNMKPKTHTFLQHKIG